MIAKQGALLIIIIFLAFISAASLVNFLDPGQFSPGSVIGSITQSSAFLVPINNVFSFPEVVRPFETITIYADITSPSSGLTVFYVCRDASCTSFYCSASDFTLENEQKTFSCSFKASSKLGNYNYYVRAVSGAYSNLLGPYFFVVR